MATDPWADPDEVLRSHGVTLTKGFCKSCDAVVVAVSHDEFASLSPDELMSMCRDPENAVLGDLKSAYDRQECTLVGFDVLGFSL